MEHRPVQCNWVVYLGDGCVGKTRFELRNWDHVPRGARVPAAKYLSLSGWVAGLVLLLRDPDLGDRRPTRT